VKRSRRQVRYDRSRFEIDAPAGVFHLHAEIEIFSRTQHCFVKNPDFVKNGPSYQHTVKFCCSCWLSLERVTHGFQRLTRQIDLIDDVPFQRIRGSGLLDACFPACEMNRLMERFPFAVQWAYNNGTSLVGAFNQSLQPPGGNDDIIIDEDDVR
jgi:hypothetical protein